MISTWPFGIGLNVMVLAPMLVPRTRLPQDLAVRRDPLHATADAAAAEMPVLPARGQRADAGAIEQVHRLAWLVPSRPRMRQLPPLKIDQVRLRRVEAV
jgi:hypothetical protein